MAALLPKPMRQVYLRRSSLVRIFDDSETHSEMLILHSLADQNRVAPLGVNCFSIEVD